MTIERESRRSDVYLGDGRNTSLPFGFKVFLPTEIVVVLNENGVERTLSHGHGCTVSLNAEQDVQPGGTVRLDAPLPTGSKAVVLSNVRPLQQVDLTNQGGFYPDVLNAVHDRLTMLIQQLMELQDRTPQVPATDNVTGKELARQIVELSRSLPEALRLLTSEEFKKLLKLIKANPNLGGVELSSAVDSVREDVAANSKAVKTAYDKAVAAEAAAANAEGTVNNVTGKLATKLDTSVFNEFKGKAATKAELEEKTGNALAGKADKNHTHYQLITESQQITVPPNVSLIFVTLIGGGGGRGGWKHNTWDDGGNGARQRACIAVSAGDVLDITIGAGGYDAGWGDNGGGGGGISKIARAGQDLLACNGGGGGLPGWGGKGTSRTYPYEPLIIGTNYGRGGGRGTGKGNGENGCCLIEGI